MAEYLYNIAPDGACKMYSGDEIRAAAADGLRLYLDIGHGERVSCRLAATVGGWCTVVMDSGTIVQDWAGAFVVK